MTTINATAALLVLIPGGMLISLVILTWPPLQTVGAVIVLALLAMRVGARFGR